VRHIRRRESSNHPRDDHRPELYRCELAAVRHETLVSV
jgi:hypothetical protein